MRSLGCGRWAIGISAAALMLGCGSTDNDSPRRERTDDGTGGTAGAPSNDAGSGQLIEEPDGPCGPVDTSFADVDADDLFEYEHVPTFDLYLPEDDWEQLQVNARDEEYVEAQACFEGKSLGRIAMRFKGAYGSLLDCFDENDVNICRKLGIKLKFDEYVDDKRFFGLKRLNFQGNRWDDSYMKEVLSYETYRGMGIYAPRASWAVLRVNDELQGLFGLVEQIDGRFTADRWPDYPDGNLYKEAWPIHDEMDYGIQHLKTNEDVPVVTTFVDFSQAVLEADGDDELRSALGEYTDLDYWARYMAVDDAIANFDGVTAYYISDDASWSGNHNFYLYQDERKHFTIIPWDLESTFFPSGFGAVPPWQQLPEDCAQTYGAWGGSNLVIAPGCDRVFRAIAADLDSYHDAGQQLLDGPFTEDHLNGLIDDYMAFIRDAVEEDPNGPGTPTWESAVASLRSQIPALRTRLEYLLAGDTWTVLEAQLDQVTDFEGQNDYGVSVGPLYMSNAATDLSASINTDDPLDGDRDLLLNFEYRNDNASPWSQWLFYRIGFPDGQADLTGLTGVRLQAVADQNRTLRIEIYSPNASAAEEGILVGWDATVSDEPTEIEVRFEDIAVPYWAAYEGRDPGDDVNLLLSTAAGIQFLPQCEGRDELTGLLPEGESDTGYLRIDDLEFF